MVWAAAGGADFGERHSSRVARAGPVMHVPHDVVVTNFGPREAEGADERVLGRALKAAHTDAFRAGLGAWAFAGSRRRTATTGASPPPAAPPSPETADAGGPLAG